MLIESNKVYRLHNYDLQSRGVCIRDGAYLRVFLVAPDSDEAVVARIDCSSTRLRKVNLSDLTSALELRRLIPVIREDKAAIAEDLRSEAAQRRFRRIKPALTELLSHGYSALAEMRLWPEMVRLAAQTGIPASTINYAFSAVIKSGGLIVEAAPKWHRCGRSKSVLKGNYKPTNQPASYHLAVADYPKIEAGVTKFYRDGVTWKEAHEKFLEYCYPENETRIGDKTIIVPLPPSQRPSLWQFKRHGMRLVGLEKRLVQQMGQRAVDTNHRGLPNGQTKYSIYPGCVAEIDWTFTDIVAVSRGNRLSIGRLTLYVIVDVYSGAILAAYVTLFSGSFYEAGCALLQCLEDKVALCARYHLKIDREQWDMQSIPWELRSDKGEIDSWKSTGLGSGLGIKLEHCPARRPDMKGTVESFFRVARYFLRKLNGGTSGIRERLKDHPNVTAIYDFEQVQKLMFVLAITFNTRVRKRQAKTKGMAGKEVLQVPNVLYKWAKDRGCMRMIPLETARVAALPTHMATVTAEGIKIKGLRYMVKDFEPLQPHGIEANDWLMNARRQTWKVEVGIDPTTVDYVWLRHRPEPGKVVVLQCFLSSEHEGWKGLSWIEYGQNAGIYRDALISYSEKQLRNAKAWARAELAATKADAEAATSPVREGMTATAQINGTEGRRRIEMNRDRSMESRSKPKESDFFNSDGWVEN